MAKVTLDKRYKTKDGRDVTILQIDAKPDNLCVRGWVDGENYDDRWDSEGRLCQPYEYGIDLIEVVEE